MRHGARGTGSVALGLVLAATGCAGSAQAPVASPAPPHATSSPGAVEDEMLVLAAASLTDVVTDLAGRLEDAHPGLDVTTAFGGSPTLAAQVAAGAPADVLVTASAQTMARATQAVGGRPVVVARNHLQLAVPVGNPADVDGLTDLADPDLTVTLCAPEVPCGALSTEVLGRAGVVAAPDTLERDVRGVVTRLRLDEADAGLVYRTDVVAAEGAVEGIELPAGLRVTTDQLALTVPDAAHPVAAAAFVELLTGPVGRRVLTDAGFEVP